MRRRPKPEKVKAEPKVSSRSPKADGTRVRTLEKARTEALEQQTAMREILRAISTASVELQPVLDEVVRSATRFCDAHDAELYRLEGTHLKVAAHHGPISAPIGRLISVMRGTTRRAIRLLEGLGYRVTLEPRHERIARAHVIF